MTTWIILRAAGIGAYLMLFGSVAWGLVATTSPMGKHISKATAVAVHQFLSTVGLVLLGAHIGGVLMDHFVKFHPLDILVPMHSTFRPVAVALGIIAMYSAVVVLTTSWTRKHIGTKWWRRMHLLAAPAFTLSLAHGVFAGTDTVRPWMWFIYLITGALVLFLVIVRALTVGLRPARAEVPVHARVPRTRGPVQPRPAHAVTAELQTAPFRADPPDLPDEAPHAPAARRQAVERPAEPRPRARPDRQDPGAVPARRPPSAAEAGPAPSPPQTAPVVLRLEVHVSVDADGQARVIGATSSESPLQAVSGAPASNGHRYALARGGPGPPPPDDPGDEEG